MVCPIQINKFIGTISLGLLTGVSYTLSSLTIPALSHLPSASHAHATLHILQTTSARKILTLASISSISLLTAYSLAGPRGKHPYLLWTALVGFVGGQGVEWWFNGFSRFPGLMGGSGGEGNRRERVGGRATVIGQGKRREELQQETSPSGSGSGYVDVYDEQGREEVEGMMEEGVNGEKVEAEMMRERRVQKIRMLVSGVGFAMGVVGIWGDGA